MGPQSTSPPAPSPPTASPPPCAAPPPASGSVYRQYWLPLKYLTYSTGMSHSQHWLAPRLSVLPVSLFYIMFVLSRPHAMLPPSIPAVDPCVTVAIQGSNQRRISQGGAGTLQVRLAEEREELLVRAACVHSPSLVCSDIYIRM